MQYDLTKTHVHVNVCIGEMEKIIKVLTDEDLKSKFS